MAEITELEARHQREAQGFEQRFAETKRQAEVRETELRREIESLKKIIAELQDRLGWYQRLSQLLSLLPFSLLNCYEALEKRFCFRHLRILRTANHLFSCVFMIMRCGRRVESILRVSCVHAGVVCIQIL